ncbi:MAG: metalloregulator ArsR/SmtB family transcription factor [Nanoarchaeota archaeon]|nr:metalloregulator ArsR/SmtB family transcription factor [Nanoarchaeota archaeon]
MKCKSYNLFFETISHKLRLKIVELLREKPLTVNEIAKKLNEEQSKISHNLKKLSDCHFVEFKKDGKNRIYSLNKETIVPLIKLVEKHVEKHCGDICRK